MLVYFQAYKQSLDASPPGNQSLFAFVSLYSAGAKFFETSPAAIVPSATTRLGVLNVSFQFALDRLTPGSYDCQITIIDPATTKTNFWRAPILIVP